jgi:hypothetical protein
MWPGEVEDDGELRSPQDEQKRTLISLLNSMKVPVELLQV